MGQLCSQESQTGWDNPAPRVLSRGKAPRPWGAGAGDSAPAASGPALWPRGFSSVFQRGNGLQFSCRGCSGEDPPSPIFGPPRASCQTFGAAAGMQMQSPHPRVPGSFCAPRHSPTGPLPARPAHAGTDNSVGWDQRSRAQRSHHYTLTSCPMEQRFLVAKINSPQSKLGARPGRASAARSLPTSPPLPQGRPRGSAPPRCVCLWVCKMDQGLALQLWAGVEHPQGVPGAPGAGISREGVLG